MKRNLMLSALMMMAVTFLFANGPGGMGAGGTMMGGSGMMVVADDGSLLVSNMDRSGMMGGGGSGDHESLLVALDLETGAERQRATVGGDMVSMAQFSPNGSRIYLSVMEWGGGGGMGQGPMRQGDAAGAVFMNSSTVVAFDRSGNQVWTYGVGGE